MDLQDCLKDLEKKEDRMANTVISWANINSHSFNQKGLEKFSDVLKEAFSPLDAVVETRPLASVTAINDQGVFENLELGPLLHFQKRPKAPFQLLLVGHMDTVYAVDHPFQTASRINESCIQGPGVTDMKGGLCVMLEALKAFEQLDISREVGWEVFINPDEEIGSLGSSPLLIEAAKRHQVGLLFEPAMDELGTIASTRKGSGRWTVIVRGHAAHAGRNFDEGRNAIVTLAKIVAKIDACNHQKPGVTLNVGRIQGGGPVNMVPDLAICYVDIRVETAMDEAWVTEIFENIRNDTNQDAGFLVECHGSLTRKPKVLTPQIETLYGLAMDVAKSLGKNLKLVASGGVCDGNTLAAAGLPNIDTLGVCGGKIHSQEEYLLVKSLTTRSQLTLALLVKISEALKKGLYSKNNPL